MKRHSPLALLCCAAMMLTVASVWLPPSSARAAERTATLVGTLQSELGCPGDWQPDCAATRLAKVAGAAEHVAEFAVPAGAHEVKVAINGSWEESYGVGGAQGGDNIPVVLSGPATVRFSYDDQTHRLTLTPARLAGAEADATLARDSLRAASTRERFYFVMADRFANGDARNDRGGLTGDRLSTGFDPSHKGFYHGGDLKGLAGKLDYIKALGATSIWLTPTFKNRPVQGAGSEASAGYHGYWITDFTQVDPHLGSNAELTALVDAAHAKGMKVFLDIITNHTADVIDTVEQRHSYVSKAQRPYTDASGRAFDDATYAGKDTFPDIDAESSFPYPPKFRSEADKTAKSPAWLNDPRLYHNRGDSTFAGESSTYGDFVGLDDLWTERHEVVEGMTKIYQAWAAFGVDGFRVDTMKHVNLEFWQAFSPAVLAAARAGGKPGFFMFGEVFESSPEVMSRYTTAGKVQATLDFGFQSAASSFAQGKATTGLRDFFADDDYYTDPDSNAYQLPTFLGNHDLGRIGMMLAKSGASGADLAARVKLAHSLMFLTRGQPVVYYGDEQGFLGAGGDQDARQDMFATQVGQYAAEPVLSGPSGSRDRFDVGAPLFRHIAALAALRAAHPALADGAQTHRLASASAGVYAISRTLARDGVEHFVVLNNATSARRATFSTYSPEMTFEPLYGARSPVRSDRHSRVSVSLPPLSAAVYRASRPMARPGSVPALRISAPALGGTVGGRAAIVASLPAGAFGQVTFAARPLGAAQWQVLGSDDNAPYRVFHDTTGLAKGTVLEYRAVVKDRAGHTSGASTAAVVGDPGSGGAGPGPVGPVTQPGAVSVPGSHNSEMGCAGDWQPDCAQAQLALDAKDRIWKRTYPGLPADSYEYKAAIDQKWDENYGAGAARNGANIGYAAPAGPVSFYYDHQTHWAATDAATPILTAPGSHQSELGCSGDWLPECMRPWLQDPDGDGTYSWSTAGLPAGNYDFKVAHGLSWAESYGAGGVKDGSNVSFSVPRDGVVVTFAYVLATHQMSVTTSAAGVAPDLKQAKAVWVSRDLIAWPADATPAGSRPEWLTWRLHAAPRGGLAVDAEAVTGGREVSLRPDPAGLPPAVLARYPHLTGYQALRLDRKGAAAAEELVRGQVAVAAYDDLGHLTDATGVQLAYVLDALYARKARASAFGVTWSRGRPTVRLWAPTARSARLLVWPAGAASTAPASQAVGVVMRPQPDGSWLARGPASWRDARYLFEVAVYAPSVGKVAVNRVTDPYSVALTLNSTRSVMVDLRDPRWQPRLWRRSAPPALAQSVDQAIYELHIRDFSIADTTVPAEQRGSYLAFAADGNGSRRLRALAEAGLNTVHLLPSFDIATIEEDPAAQLAPGCDLAGFPPDGEEQQRCVKAVAAKDAFNWGYDPYHFMAPEGSYASTAAAADGGARVAEFRTMVGALHADGLRVVLDQVFNHTAASGQAERSVLDKVVPGYYHRLDAKGAVTTSTCCQNVATEHAMAQRLMVDAVVVWAKHYKVDGFRFDLMGHHSRDNMLAVRAALDALTMRRDGVDGSAITLYGEGWNFGEVADNARFTQATQGQLGGTGIATFSDRLRDAVRGGGPFDEDPRVQGFGSGLAADPNGAPVNGDAAKQAERLAHDTDLLQLGMAGNLRAFRFRSQATGELVTGADVRYGGAPAGYADEPDEVVTYVDAHDNETLFDSLTLKLPRTTPMGDRIRMNTLSLATVALSQTTAFWHAGADLLRSKSLDRNSYDSGDWFNLLDWTGLDNGFGRGLPPQADNGSKWAVMRPLLGDGALKPTAAQVQTAGEAALDLLRLRYSTPLFRLGSAALINAKVSFPASGGAAAQPGVIAMRVDDTVGPDSDPALAGLVVVVNATPGVVAQQVPGLAGATLSLSPVQAAGSDPVVKTSTWDAATGVATVPARTVAVFVQPSP